MCIQKDIKSPAKTGHTFLPLSSSSKWIHGIFTSSKDPETTSLKFMDKTPKQPIFNIKSSIGIDWPGQ